MKNNSISRRDFLKAMGLTAGAIAANSMLAGCQSDTTADADMFYFGTLIRTLSNEYHAAWYRGGRLFAESVGYGEGHQGLHCEGDSERQITLMRSLISEAGENVVFNCDPNQSPDARAIAELCAENEVYFLTQWNKPDDLHPWDFDPYWVAHMGVDGVPSGKFVATKLFEAMGGEGKIVALQGLLANVPAQQRFQGLQEALAEFPGIELLEDQTAEWDRTKAVGVTEAFLAKYPDVQGVWAANDNMGLGALEALRTTGKAGEILTCGIDGTSEAIQACIDGEFAATVNNDPMWQGGMGLSIPYHAKIGEIDVANLPREHREFYFTPVFVDMDNAAQIKAEYIDGIPNYDWKDFWGRVQA